MMKKNAKTQRLFEDETKQQARYEKLFGPGDYTATIANNMKYTMWLIIALCILLLLLLILQISKSNLENQGITLDSNGNVVSIVRPSSGTNTIVLEADIISDSGKLLSDQGIKLIISPLQTEAQQKLHEEKESTVSKVNTIQHEIRKAAYQLNSDTTVRTVTLPKKLQDGTQIHWVPKKTSNEWIVAFVLMIGVYMIYHSRDAGLVKMEKVARESVLRELPEFVNQLVLLLNAGLIISRAFNKIVSEQEKIRGGENNYFYGQLAHIILKCSKTNGSVQYEIRCFAVRTGVVEFMRISNIINDSMTKGSDLMTQLRMEGDSLWAARRKQIEVKGKNAEHKLTVPLVIL